MVKTAAEIKQLQEQLRSAEEQVAKANGTQQGAPVRFRVNRETGAVTLTTGAVYVVNTERVAGRVVGRIDTFGLSDSVREQIVQKLPVHIGDTFTHDIQEATTQAVTSFDEHFSLRYYPLENGQMAIAIGAPGTRMEPRHEPQLELRREPQR